MCYSVCITVVFHSIIAVVDIDKTNKYFAVEIQLGRRNLKCVLVLQCENLGSSSPIDYNM